MAPEQVDHAVHEATDTFALGSTMYEVMMGRQIMEDVHGEKTPSGFSGFLRIMQTTDAQIESALEQAFEGGEWPDDVRQCLRGMLRVSPEERIPLAQIRSVFEAYETEEGKSALAALSLERESDRRILRGESGYMEIRVDGCIDCFGSDGALVDQIETDTFYSLASHYQVRDRAIVSGMEACVDEIAEAIGVSSDDARSFLLERGVPLRIGYAPHELKEHDEETLEGADGGFVASQDGLRIRFGNKSFFLPHGKMQSLAASAEPQQFGSEWYSPDPGQSVLQVILLALGTMLEIDFESQVKPLLARYNLPYNSLYDDEDDLHTSAASIFS